MPDAVSCDIEALLEPVSGDQPAGPDRYDDPEVSQLYGLVETAVRDAKTSLRKQNEARLFPEDSIERQAFRPPDWRAVEEQAVSLLRKSKHAWVAIWLMEALAHQYGFAGLRDGMRLVRGLCERYWGQLHPVPDPGDSPSYTVTKLDAVVVCRLLQYVPITKGGLTVADYEKSSEMETLPDASEREAYQSAGVLTIAEFNDQVLSSGADFLRQLLDDAKQAQEEYALLTQCLDARCGEDAPSSSAAEEEFRRTIELIEELAAPLLPEDATESSEPTETANNQDGLPKIASGWDRAAAFQRIRQLADLFVKNEPTSPVAWMLRRAADLGNLTWPELIQALSGDAAQAKTILSQSGIAETKEGT